MTRSRFRRHLSPLAFAPVLFCPLEASAQAESGETRSLEEVVVTASGFEQELKEAPASMSVVTRQDLETRNYRDLAEALQDVEGIDVRGGTGKSGGLDISIRGMPSDYTLILIDGRRQNVAGDVTPNGFGAALNSFMPPVSAIERIEVIRGPMSTLYGSDAMGGVINIITRKVAKHWAARRTCNWAFRSTATKGSSARSACMPTAPSCKTSWASPCAATCFSARRPTASGRAAAMRATRGPAKAASTIWAPN